MSIDKVRLGAGDNRVEAALKGAGSGADELFKAEAEARAEMAREESATRVEP